MIDDIAGAQTSAKTGAQESLILKACIRCPNHALAHSYPISPPPSPPPPSPSTPGATPLSPSDIYHLWLSHCHQSSCMCSYIRFATGLLPQYKIVTSAVNNLLQSHFPIKLSITFTASDCTERETERERERENHCKIHSLLVKVDSSIWF